MSTNTNSISEEEIETIKQSQIKLCLWLYEQGTASWNRIHKTCLNIVAAFPQNQQVFFGKGNYPEYKIFVPLLRWGSIEICRIENRKTFLYCMNSDLKLDFLDGTEYIRPYSWTTHYQIPKDVQQEQPSKKVFLSLDFLKAYPSINQQVHTFSEAKIEKALLKYEFNFYGWQFEPLKNVTFEPGIYKTSDQVWIKSYLIDKEKKIYEIPSYEKNPEGIMLSRLYVYINSTYFTSPIFEYKKESMELLCNKYNELPILLSRALLLFCPNQLSKSVFRLADPKTSFKNIPESAVGELKRIFTPNKIKFE